MINARQPKKSEMVPVGVKGWVAAQWGVSGNSRRARLYRLTPAGRRQLAEEVADFERLLEAILRVVRPA